MNQNWKAVDKLFCNEIALFQYALLKQSFGIVLLCFRGKNVKNLICYKFLIQCSQNGNVGA